MPESAKGSITCKACGQNVTGFYYSCAECSIWYHILCAGLPVSVSICSHSHPLKLEYSLPYNFECDLCQKPGYNGWLYRCRLCEFDSHLGCAISNQLSYSPSGSESSELNQLVFQGIGLGDVDSTKPPGTLAGWHQKLNSPKKKHSQGTGLSEDSVGPFGKKLDNPIWFYTIAGGHSDHSNDLSMLLSNQFSENSYFSIDIARSYNQGQQNQANKDVKQENGFLLDRITSNLESAKQDSSMLFLCQESKEALLITAKEQKQNKAKETGSKGSSHEVSSVLLMLTN